MRKAPFGTTVACLIFCFGLTGFAFGSDITISNRYLLA